MDRPNSLQRLELILQKDAALKVQHAKQDLTTRDRLARLHRVHDSALYAPHRIPAQHSPMRRTPALIRHQFRHDLTALIDQAFASSPSPTVEYAAPQPRDGAELDQTAHAVNLACHSACADCRGACCCTGLTNLAWLTIDTIQRYRRQHPGRTAAELVADYLAHLGPRSVQDSCVFHGVRGCTLPREMRSDTCNGHFCRELQTFRARMAGQSEVRVFFVRPRSTEGGLTGQFVHVVAADESVRAEVTSD